MTTSNLQVFSPTEALRFGWDKATASWNGLIWITGAGALLSLLQNPPGHPPGGAASLLALAAHVGQIAVMLVLLRAALLLHDDKPLPAFTFKDSLAGFLPFLLTYVLCGLIVAAGMVLLIVPGVLWGLRFGFAPLLMAEERSDAQAARPSLDPVAALRESSRITEGSRGQLFRFGALCLGVNLLGALALGVGLLLTVPTTCIAAVYVLRRLQEHAPRLAETPTAPLSHPLVRQDPATGH